MKSQALLLDALTPALLVAQTCGFHHWLAQKLPKIIGKYFFGDSAPLRKLLFDYTICNYFLCTATATSCQSEQCSSFKGIPRVSMTHCTTMMPL
jgi:hypothetical protein